MGRGSSATLTAPLPPGGAQVVGLHAQDEVVLRGMLALEAALVAHGAPLPAAAGSATAVTGTGGSSAGVAAEEGVQLVDASGARGRLYRQAYCPEPTLLRTLAEIEAAKPGARRPGQGAKYPR